MSRARQLHRCEKHGLVLKYVRDLGSKPASPTKPRKSLKRTQPKRDWSDARRKVEDEMVCRVCGGNQDVQAAHVIGRECDEPSVSVFDKQNTILYVAPDSIVPLCGQFSPLKCHVEYDAHALDLLEFLTPAEQVQAVRDAGGIESARRRTSPSSYRILPSPNPVPSP